MERAPRADEAGGIYHALNRGNAKQPFFFKDADYEAFERIIVEAFWKRVMDRIHHRALRS
ncbi:MAG: hypothetical protein Q8M16_01825 [Pirellulaceae bacterium]|nr:hypothetical protein [Pirellulaceae bacterium]